MRLILCSWLTFFPPTSPISLIFFSHFHIVLQTRLGPSCVLALYGCGALPLSSSPWRFPCNSFAFYLELESDNLIQCFPEIDYLPGRFCWTSFLLLSPDFLSLYTINFSNKGKSPNNNLNGKFIWLVYHWSEFQTKSNSKIKRNKPLKLINCNSLIWFKTLSELHVFYM